MSPASGSAARRVRCLHEVVEVPGHPAPYDRIQIRIHYLAEHAGSEAERMSGVVPAARAATPWPVVMIVPGVNIAPESYRWLAVLLAERGYAVVTYSWVDELFGGHVGLTPGLDLELAHADRYGTGPTGTAIGPILGHLADPGPVLQGCLDLNRVALGGHSGGGTVALQSADQRWVPGLRGVFAYASHTMTATALGWPEATLAPVPTPLPVLLMAGSRDGVIAASRARYGTGDGQHDPVRSTWEQAVDPASPGSYLLFGGATHFSFVDPFDPTSGRSFLEGPPADPNLDQQLRALMAAVVGAFLDEHVAAGVAAGPTVPDLVADHPLILDQRHRSESVDSR